MVAIYVLTRDFEFTFHFEFECVTDFLEIRYSCKYGKVNDTMYHDSRKLAISGIYDSINPVIDCIERFSLKTDPWLQ